MDKITQTYKKIITQANNRDPYNWKEVMPIFNAQIDQIMKKINKRFKWYGFKNIKYVPYTKGPHFSDGHRWGLFLKGKPEQRDDKWWECLRSMEGIQTKNLIFVWESNPQICYKKSYRKESHRGQININNIGPDWI